VRPVCR